MSLLSLACEAKTSLAFVAQKVAGRETSRFFVPVMSEEAVPQVYLQIFSAPKHDAFSFVSRGFALRVLVSARARSTFPI